MKKLMTMKTAQALEDSNFSLKGVTKTTKNETKEQKGGFSGKLSGTLEVSYLGKMLAGKGIVRADYRNRKWKEIVRAAYGNEMKF